MNHTITLRIECPRWLVTAARIALPVLAISVAGAALSAPPTFTSGQTLTAADLNALASHVDGPVALSPSSGYFTTQSDTPVPLPNNAVTLATEGGMVRLELAPDGDPTASSRLWVIGAGGGADPWMIGNITFQRSSDGTVWADLKTEPFGGVPSTVGSTMVPPGAFTFLDTPTAGAWQYRVLVSRKSNAGDLTIHVDNVRLIARELGTPQ